MGRKKSFVCGVGINDFAFPTSLLGKHTTEYKLWANMLYRSHDTSFKEKHPSYANVTCDVRWHSMTAFIDEVSTLVGYEQAINNGWCLDKDILIKGNKLYSKDTCCFVPVQINNLILDNRTQRGDHPIGVSFSKHARKFRAYLIGLNGKQKHLGYFEEESIAFEAYRLAKKAQIEEVLIGFKGKIDDKVYQALIEWEIGIND